MSTALRTRRLLGRPSPEGMTDWWMRFRTAFAFFIPGGLPDPAYLEWPWEERFLTFS